MTDTVLDFDVIITRDGSTYTTRAGSLAHPVEAHFELPFAPTELAQFMVAVGPPRATSRRVAPAASRVLDVREYGARLGDALLAGEVRAAFTEALRSATSTGRQLRLRLRLDRVPELDVVPWEYLYDRTLDRFLALSRQTPVVRLIDPLEQLPPVVVDPPLRVLVMISSPSDLPALAVAREEQLLRATTADLVAAGQIELVLLEEATLGALQRALLDEFHVFHFIGHGGFDRETQEGVLVLEREDGTAHRVSGSRLGTLLHDARHLQLAVLNACEGARTSGRDAFSGVAQELVRRGLPAVIAIVIPGRIVDSISGRDISRATAAGTSARPSCASFCLITAIFGSLTGSRMACATPFRSHCRLSVRPLMRLSSLPITVVD